MNAEYFLNMETGKKTGIQSISQDCGCNIVVFKTGAHCTVEEKGNGKLVINKVYSGDLCVDTDNKHYIKYSGKLI